MQLVAAVVQAVRRLYQVRVCATSSPLVAVVPLQLDTLCGSIWPAKSIAFGCFGVTYVACGDD